MHDSGNGLNRLIGFILLIFALVDLINSLYCGCQNNQAANEWPEIPVPHPHF